MQIGNYLKEYQPVIYQTFTNCLKNNTLSHAFLIVGNPGTPLFDTAKYLAKTILCDSPDPLACDNCITCLRFDSENYPDVVMVDGSKGTIKKEHITKIENQFVKTALETKGIMIYIINLVENMTVEAVNSMLKFLEEPDAKVYAFLTTNNENNVLPTIISRCQTFYLKNRKRDEVIYEAMDLNVEQEDAEILSAFYNDGEAIYNFTKKEEFEDYSKLRVEIINMLSILPSDKREAKYIVDSKILPLLKNKEDTKFFLDILVTFFEDVLNKECSRDISLKSYDTIITELNNCLHHKKESLIEICKQRNKINLNLNSGLLLDHLIEFITKE